MENPDDGPIALDAYETLAASYAELAERKPHNAYYDRPAVLSLLPDLRGRKVLDAGCGPAIYSHALIERGASVVAIDVSPKMLEHAKKRLGANAEIYQADLRKPLNFLPDSAFDAVVCALVMDYLEDWRGCFEEFFRLLVPGGVLVFSAESPLSDFHLRARQDYFRTEKVRITWRGFGTAVDMPSFRRPLCEMINPLLEAGFRLDKVLEPKPTAEFEAADPEGFAELSLNPGFICFRAVKC
jgi:SAM-dependent methyltransferase